MINSTQGNYRFRGVPVSCYRLHLFEFSTWVGRDVLTQIYGVNGVDQKSIPSESSSKRELVDQFIAKKTVGLTYILLEKTIAICLTPADEFFVETARSIERDPKVYSTPIGIIACGHANQANVRDVESKLALFIFNVAKSCVNCMAI